MPGMLALPHRGLVLLSTPKCGSTALEEALSRHALVVFRGSPAYKHLKVQDFDDLVAPTLAALGHPRSSYEVVCLFREPLDWLASWWRYRARPEIKRNRELARNFTGEQSFEEFGRTLLAGPVHGIHDQARVATRRDDRALGVDRIFRYEDREVWQDWISARLPGGLELPQANVSIRREAGSLSDETRAGLLARQRRDVDVYTHLTDTGEWAPPKGYVPGA
jgi:hypothetical protein